MKQFFKNLQSLQIKIVLIYVLLIVIGMQIIGLFFTNTLERQLTENFKDNISAQATTIESRIQSLYEEYEEDVDTLHDELSVIFRDYSNRTEINEIRFVNVDNILLATSSLSNESIVKTRVSMPTTAEALQTGTQNEEIYLNVDSNNQRVWILNQPVYVDGSLVGVIYIASHIEAIFIQLDQINSIFIIATGIALIITVLLGFFIARTITKPITDMRNQALQMSEGDYTSRVKVYSKDEIGELAEGFNILSKRVQEAQANTESEKNRLDSVITHMSDGVLATDRRGRVRVVNDMAMYMLGKTEEEVYNQDLMSLLNLHEEMDLEDIKKEISERTVTGLAEDSRFSSIRISFSAIVKDTGFINGYIAVLHDVTEQEKVDNERREFVANVSHELRTPLTSMKSYIEALQDGAYQDDELATKFLGVTRDETDRMSRLVEDLLQLSRMDNDAEEISPELVDFNSYLNRVIDRFEMSHKDTVTFIRSLPDEAIFVEIALDKMTQVLDNVISNAIKYSNNTDKRVEIKIKQNKLYNRLTLQIKDNGLGIPAGKIDRIFDRFYRVDKGRARKMGGTGLGLAISKEIVEAHDGKIWASSIETEGTSIYINLPIMNIDEDDWYD
ncbi:MAG TPA: cell wall metabolism sensor histidine kinase WalK [Aliicoccus persicus]|uniref:Sensor protein kinase WalK n=1 Tax=Aliicoccus persicus TaxID=930138 RepID=A0A921DXV6_9STAP|nr:cell wall metabolism sensor histidine kinase WalK [Aliicoccus persicus]